MCAVREQNKCRITPGEIEFMRTAKYTWQYYKTGEGILSELKLTPVVKKMQHYRNKWIYFRQMDRNRLPHLTF
jgi:hypothetical protein